MGAVADFISDIADVVTDIADAIWDQIKQIGDWLEDQLGWLNVALIVLVIVAVAIGLPAAIAAYEGAMLSAVIASSGSLAGLDLVAAQAISAAIALEAGFSAFLTAIYFDVILTVHNIAYLVSPHYREMFQKVLNEIMNISHILGLGPSFIVLALENARTLVLTTSGLLGMKYDMAQVQWLGILSNYLKEFAGKVRSYRNNPGLLLLDMGELINRPVMDQMGAYMQTIIGTIDDTIDNAEKVAQAVTAVERDLTAFIDDLPENLKRQIKPYTDPILNRINSFIKYDFKPSIDVIHGVIGVLETKQQGIKSQIDDTIERLLYPGKYLHEIDALDSDLQNEQAWSIAEVSNRPERELYEVVDQGRDVIRERLKSILDALATRLPKPAYALPEVPRPVIIPQIEMEERNTWFVGDY